jgi:hypothetical protein
MNIQPCSALHRPPQESDNNILGCGFIPYRTSFKMPDELRIATELTRGQKRKLDQQKEKRRAERAAAKEARVSVNLPETTPLRRTTRSTMPETTPLRRSARTNKP